MQLPGIGLYNRNISIRESRAGSHDRPDTQIQIKYELSYIITLLLPAGLFAAARLASILMPWWMQAYAEVSVALQKDVWMG